MNWRALVVALLLPSLANAQMSPPVFFAPKPVLQIVPPLDVGYVAPPLIAVPAGDDKIVPVTAGDPAPFTGALYDPSTALRWAHYLQQAKLRLTADVVAERKVCNAHLKYYERHRTLEEEYNLRIQEDLKERVLSLEQDNSDLSHQLNNPGFFQRPGTWFGAGVLGTVLVVGLTVFATDRVK